MDWRYLQRISFLEPPSRGVSICIILLLTLMATVARIVLAVPLGPNSPFITFIPVIVFSAWMAGFEGGLAATVLASVIADCLFLPYGGSARGHAQNISRVELFAAEGVLIAALGHAQSSARRRERSTAHAAAQSAQLADARAVALADSEDKMRLAIEGAHIGTWEMDVASNSVRWSDTMKALLGRPDADTTDPSLGIETVHPDDREMIRSSIRASIESNVEFNVEFRCIWPDESIRWLVSRGKAYKDENGRTIRLQGIAIDITDRRLAEEEATRRARTANALNTISKAIRESRPHGEVRQIALDLLAEILQVDRCLSILLNKEAGKVVFEAEWHRPDLPDIRGEYNLADFDVDLDEVFPASAALIVDDVENFPQFSELSLQTLRSLQIRALLDIPMSVDGRIIGVLGVYMAENVRHWTSDEVSFVQSVAAQLRAAIEASRALAEAQSRAEREALINRISGVMRTSLDPEIIQEKAVALLGEALGADRCYFAVYDLANSTVTVGRDWHRADLPSIRGVHAFGNTSEMFSELYHGDETSIISDRDNSMLSQQTIENMKSLQIRSRLSVAVADMHGMATLTATMSDIARDWTPDDVELIEKVASLLRSGVEMARVQQREHRIAVDLQAALVPPVPDSVPGLEIGACLHAALDEAEIGGDFYDVFCLDEHIAALVIGDVSGKGLAAAAQLAMVRNSLRTSLYIYRTPADALTVLNNIIAEQALLSGFVTLFVAIYDHTDGSLIYSSCGHEPALLHRYREGKIERLRTKGTPIGVVPGEQYVESYTVLAPGDTLFLYTDGLSEAGPNRQEMIEIDGLAGIFSRLPDMAVTNKSANEIVQEVADFAHGNFRDDVCVLLARRSLVDPGDDAQCEPADPGEQLAAILR